MSAPSSTWIFNAVSNIIHHLYFDITKNKELPLVLMTNVVNKHKIRIIAETSKIAGKNTIRFYYENLFRYIEGKEFSWDIKYPTIKYKVLKVVIHELFHIAQDETKFITIDELEKNINEQTFSFIKNNKTEIEKWYGKFTIPRKGR